eukprot:8706798-Ditylum_brightwellii.AAC.1
MGNINLLVRMESSMKTDPGDVDGEEELSPASYKPEIVDPDSVSAFPLEDQIVLRGFPLDLHTQ